MNTQEQQPYPGNKLMIPRLALALSLIVVGGIIAYFLYREYVHIEQREQERLAAQAKIIDENITWQLDGVYRALEGIRKDLLLWREKSGMATADYHLKAMADAMPGIRTFLITDAAGKIIVANREQVLGQNIRYREYFQAPLKGRNLSTLYISPPFKTLLGNFVINVALMIPGPKGEFDGVVSAALDPEYFKTLLGSVRYAPDMWAGMAHGDGKQFLMVPERVGMAGLDLAKPGSFFTRHQGSGQSASVLTGYSLATGENRMMALRTIRPDNIPMDKPLVATVGRNISALYTDWRREVFGMTALFGILAMAMASALYFYQLRQQKYETISGKYLEELLQAKEAAQLANEAKSRLLVTVAHEFRTPLSLLTSSTDILDRYGERLTREERTQQNDHIRNAAQQMSGLVDAVLAFNRMDMRNLKHAPVAVDVGRFCYNLVEEIKMSCCNEHEFRVVIANDCGTALLDKVLFRRILENLLSNAFRYTPKGGTVSLHVTREGDRLHVVVADSGIGIPEEDQKRIFEAFYRSRNVEARRGLGLGLSIVYEALSQIGGTITADSRVGEGTTMRVNIPIIDPPDAKEPLPCIQS